MAARGPSPADSGGDVSSQRIHGALSVLRSPSAQSASTQRRIQDHHHDKAEDQSDGGKCFVALAM
jgi:hypothetical protein